MDVSDKKSEARYRAERFNRMRVASIVAPALTGVFVVLMAKSIDIESVYFLSFLNRQIVLATGFSLIAISGFSAAMVYLQTGFNYASKIEAETIQIENELTGNTSLTDNQALARYRELAEYQAERELELTESINKLRQDLTETRAEFESVKNSSLGIPPAERDEIIDKLKTSIESESKGRVLEELRRLITADQRRGRQERELLESLHESRARLMKELESLGWRGNLNLTLGALTTIIGLILLGMSVFSELSTEKDILTLVSHFAPRLTLVLMIELFAYFFLSLYKSSLNEIKYFQNELTNIEAKQVALRMALYGADQTVISNVIAKLADTDRNHILSKDQTTVELEKTRIERDGRGEVARYLSEFFVKKA